LIGEKNYHVGFEAKKKSNQKSNEVKRTGEVIHTIRDMEPYIVKQRTLNIIGAPDSYVILFLA
jgi:hypothetical protein